MGCIHFDGGVLCGNFNKVTKTRPKNWIDTGYKIVVPYKFKWRHKIGKVKCDCKVCEEHYQPYYGIQWFHSKECALMQYIKKCPQILCLWQFAGRDMELITSTE